MGLACSRKHCKWRHLSGLEISQQKWKTNCYQIAAVQVERQRRWKITRLEQFVNPFTEMGKIINDRQLIQQMLLTSQKYPFSSLFFTNKILIIWCSNELSQKKNEKTHLLAFLALLALPCTSINSKLCAVPC